MLKPLAFAVLLLGNAKKIEPAPILRSFVWMVAKLKRELRMSESEKKTKSCCEEWKQKSFTMSDELERVEAELGVAHATIDELRAREAREVAQVLALQSAYDIEASKCAAMSQCMREVAEELRRCPVDSPYGFRDMAKRLEAARAATYKAGPEREVRYQAKQYVSGRLVSATDTGWVAEQKQPEPERCNATIRRADGVVLSCSDVAGHRRWHDSDVSSDESGDIWKDEFHGAKPHVPAREEPKCTCAGTHQESLQCRIHAYGERPEMIERSRYEAAVAAQNQIAKERDEARAEADANHRAFAACKTEVEKLRGELQAFRDAEDRPWFCRSCNGHGRLKPFGRYGFKCEQCSCEYIQDGVSVDSVERRNKIVQLRAEIDRGDITIAAKNEINNQLRAQLATLKAEMIRLVGGA